MERADADIRELNELLNDAEKKIIVTNDQTINLLGKTGAGKSTLLCLLSKFPPKVKFDEISGGIQVDFEQSQGSKIVIGHSSTSCTTLPNFKNINNKIYWDCPGFCDNKSVSQEIVNLYCTKRIFESARDYKIILVIEYSSLLTARGKDISETFKQLVEMFPEQNKLFNSLSIVVTKCSQRRFSSQMFINNLVKMAEENNEFESSRPLIGMLSRASNKVSIFKVPEEESDINDNLRVEVETSIGNSSFTKMEVRNSLSDKAKRVIDNLITFYESDIEAKMTKFAESIVIKFRSESNMDKLTGGKSALDDFTSLANNQNLNIEAFKSRLSDLSKYFTDSEALIEQVNNIARRVSFYNSYRSEGCLPINLNSWIMPLCASRAELESTINFRNKEQALKQAEEYKKANEEKVKKLEAEIQTINNNKQLNDIMLQMLTKSIETASSSNISLIEMVKQNRESNEKMAAEQQLMNKRLMDHMNRPQAKESFCQIF